MEEQARLNAAAAPQKETMFKYWMVHNSAGGGPTNKKHLLIKDAVEEAQRLATSNPGRRYTVLETIACFQASIPVAETVSMVYPPQEETIREVWA